MRLAAIALAAIALALAACGEGETEHRSASGQAKARRPAPAAPADPQRRAIAAVLERYAAAIRGKDAATICDDLLSSAVRKVIRKAGGDCERDLVADAIASGGTRYRLVVRSIVVRGDSATARMRVTDRDRTQDRPQPLVRERGRWLLTTPQAEAVR